MALTNKQQAFANEYLLDFNATQAAIRAGYSERTARSQGQRLLTNVDVAEEISLRVADKAMTADEALVLLADHARGDIKDYIKAWDGGFTIDVDKAIREGKSHLIKKLGFNKFNKPEIELYDAQSAILNILKIHGKFKELVEHTGPDGGAFQIKVIEGPKDVR